MLTVGAIDKFPWWSVKWSGVGSVALETILVDLCSRYMLKLWWCTDYTGEFEFASA